MPEIRPFPGIFYRVPDAELPKVLAPPYDVIPPAYQEELYARDPRNVVRVVLNRLPGDPGYAEAGALFARWMQEGLLAPDERPALYVLEQGFSSEGRTLRRFGLLARFRAVNPEERVVLPHEHTRAAAKEDRWKVLLATRANFSPIFLMFPDPERRFTEELAQAMSAPPVLHYTDDGHTNHRLWRITDPDRIATFAAMLGGVKAYIADGHHRYATALRYRDAHGPDGAWTLGYFTPMESPGLLIQPYHRILSAGPTRTAAEAALGARFELRSADSVGEAAARVARSSRPYAFALAWPDAPALVAESKDDARDLLPSDTPASLRVLDTYFLHKAVLGPLLGVFAEAVSYVHSLAEAEGAVRTKACALAVLLRGTPARQIVDVAEAGESMPAKSTFFHPKLPSGLVIHPLIG
ncbi:MAG TPA: DUF1015 domain-containing protein [Vicinamibacteria bacterium]